MSNRDGRGAKENKSTKFWKRKKGDNCPICKSSLDGCGSHGNGHKHHVCCKTCGFSNF